MNYLQVYHNNNLVTYHLTIPQQITNEGILIHIPLNYTIHKLVLLSNEVTILNFDLLKPQNSGTLFIPFTETNANKKWQLVCSNFSNNPYYEDYKLIIQNEQITFFDSFGNVLPDPSLSTLGIVIPNQLISDKSNLIKLNDCILNYIFINRSTYEELLISFKHKTIYLPDSELIGSYTRKISYQTSEGNFIELLHV